MRTSKRIFKPFANLVIPVTPGMNIEGALGLAEALGGRANLIGLVPVASEASLSAASVATRALRKSLQSLAAEKAFCTPMRVVASHHPWQDLLAMLIQNPPDLLILEWPAHFDILQTPLPGILTNPVCDVAIVRGPWPVNVHRALVPVRGGPYAELALRMGLALQHQELLALHLTSPEALDIIEAPFRGLARILPSLSGVIYQRKSSAHPVDTILQQAGSADLLVLGGSSNSGDNGIGQVAEDMLRCAPCPTVVVKSRGRLPETWTGLEGELAGAQAISVLVDHWFAENTYHADEFDDIQRLVRLKHEQGLTISLALPALNEEETVGQVIQTVKSALMDQYPLVDEIVLIDSNSTDRTREIAESMGVPVYIHQMLLPEQGGRRGKGEALWKSLHVTHGDLVVWIDTDIVNIDPRFVYGVIGPMLINPKIQFVKGFYRRPLREAGQLQAGGGGRVTELTARPMINLFYPELSGVIQPLSGEYGGRRKALEQMPFFSGYGVEIGLLIDIFDKFGLSSIAQVDLLERVHHNQSLEALSKMSYVILQAIFHKLEKRFNRPILEEINKSMKLIRYQEEGYYLDVEEVKELERPPMLEVPGYLDR
jgi:glycosyltransferase involved in cell wall biosynthesis